MKSFKSITYQDIDPDELQNNRRNPVFKKKIEDCFANKFRL